MEKILTPKETSPQKELMTLDEIKAHYEKWGSTHVGASVLALCRRYEKIERELAGMNDKVEQIIEKYNLTEVEG